MVAAPALSIEPGALFEGSIVASATLYGPGTHPRGPLENHDFARMVNFDPNIHGYRVRRQALWTPIERGDLSTAGAGALPLALRRLWILAVEARWLVRLSWQATYDMDHPAGIGHPFATLETARRADPASEAPTGWQFQYTWHTYPHGTYRLSGKIARTPQRAAWHDGPSLTVVHDTIRAHPVL
jgi:hypothetical protein